jgi:hypothetical protein
MLDAQVWPPAERHMGKDTGLVTNPSKLKTFVLQETEIGNNTMRVLCELMLVGFFPALEVRHRSYQDCIFSHYITHH